MRLSRTTLVLQCLCMLFQSRETAASSWKSWMGEKDAKQEALAVSEEDTPSPESFYGVDVSFPMHHHNVTTLPSPFGDTRRKFYDDYLQGCKDYFKDDSCDKSERHRISMCVDQPRISQNFTTLGFAKIRAPLAIRKPLKALWDEYYLGGEVEERVPAGNTFTNQWQQYSYVWNTNNDGLNLQRELMEAVRPILEKWTGVTLSPALLFGIRYYIKQAVVAPHVDKAPLVVSAIFNVGQEVEEPWPLELIGHDGMAYNLTLEPGDMVLYEGHSVIHGRPFQLNGTFVADVYFHFEPHGYSERLDSQMKHDEKGDLKELYKAAMNRKKLGKRNSSAFLIILWKVRLKSPDGRSSILMKRVSR